MTTIEPIGTARERAIAVLSVPPHPARDTSCAQLVEMLGVDLTPSRVVSVDDQALFRLEQHLVQRPDLTSQPPFTWDDPEYWLVDATSRERSQYFAVGTAINFRFWRLESRHLIPVRGTLEGRALGGAMYMWRCLRLAAIKGDLPVLNADFLADLTVEDFNTIFGDDTGRNPLDIAASDRIANLRDLGCKLRAGWGGDFWNVIQASGGSLGAFSRLSRDFRAFDDPLYKLTMLNVILHTGAGLASFDADPLPAIDYHLVKQLLRHGVLVPIAAIRDKLAERRHLSHFEAGELRRMALRAFVEMAQRTGVPGHVLDNLWWGNRQRCAEEAPVCADPATAAECPFLAACGRLTDFGMPLEYTRYY